MGKRRTYSASGGESKLTEHGRRLLGCYESYVTALREQAKTLFDEYFGDEL